MIVGRGRDNPGGASDGDAEEEAVRQLDARAPTTATEAAVSQSLALWRSSCWSLQVIPMPCGTAVESLRLSYVRLLSLNHTAQKTEERNTNLT